MQSPTQDYVKMVKGPMHIQCKSGSVGFAPASKLSTMEKMALKSNSNVSLGGVSSNIKE